MSALYESQNGQVRAYYRFSPTASSDTNFARTIFNAESDQRYRVVAASLRTTQLGTATIQLVNCVSGTSLGTATPMFNSAMNMSQAINVPTYANIIGSTTVTDLAPSSSLGIVFNTQGALACDGIFEVVLQRM